VDKLISDAVAEANTEFAQVETVKAFRLLPKELDQEDGEVTATQKVKRAAIAAEFADLIESMYGGA
jgi:long-chain acyl-CoA synthetase